MPKNLINYREAAELLGVKPHTVQIWTSQKRIPHIKLGGRAVRYDRDELDKWVASQHVEPVGGAR
jgi:excisionase family DNA binding protein